MDTIKPCLKCLNSPCSCKDGTVEIKDGFFIVHIPTATTETEATEIGDDNEETI